MKLSGNRWGWAQRATRMIALGLLALLFLTVGSSRVDAQISNPKELAASNPSGAYNSILGALGQGNYEQGLELVNEVIRYWGPRAAEQFGPGFGHFYYLKGLLQMGLEDYAGAIDSFRICREDYSNELINVEGEREGPRLQNRFRTHALAQWGACLMIVGDYTGAVEKLEATLAEAGGVRIRTDVIGINLGRSYLRSGDLVKGKGLLTKALRSEKLAVELKRRAFMILAEDWSPEVEFGEVERWLWEFGDLVRNDTRGNRWSRNPLFAFLGRQALESDDPLRALTWYSYLLNPEELADHRRKSLAELESGSAEAGGFQEQIAELEKGIAEADSMVAAMLLGVGGGHYQLRNYSGAFVAFQQVVESFPDHEKRPDSLYNLVASSAQLFLWNEARHYGLMFLDQYPDHILVGEVARLLVESTFLLQNWEEAFSIAEEVRKRFEVGTLERDVPDFIVGASLYHLDRYEEANRELDSYLKHYETPRRLEAATYYSGSVKVKLFRWQEGAEILERFMETWPGSDLLSSALYQAALARFVLDELDAADGHVERLLADFSNAVEVPASWNLKGDILTARGDREFEEIESVYQRALELAAGHPVHFDTGAYGYWKLVLLHAGDQRHESAVGLYDEYRKLYADSRLETEVVAAAVDSLVETGRQGEAELALKRLIVAHANEAESGTLGELMGTWTDFLESNLIPDQIDQRIADFPIPKSSPLPLIAWLKLVRLERWEKRSDPENSETTNPKVEALYSEVADLEPIERIPNYPLIKVARWHQDSERSKEAREIYEFILENRPRGPHVEMAMFDLAAQLSVSENEEELDRSLSLFQRVREEFEEPALQEASVLEGGRVLARRGDFVTGKVWWTDYLRHQHWMRARPEANFQFGRCLEETGERAEALKIYASVYALYPGHLDWSTQAYLRAAQILKGDGRDGDALLVLVDMLKRLGHLEHEGIDEGRKLFTEWKKEWIENS